MIQNTVPLAFLLITLGSSLYYIWNARKTGKIPWVRQIPAISAIKEAVGRATELGKPVLQCFGEYDIQHAEHGPAMMASISIAEYISKLCADVGVTYIAVCPRATPIPLLTEVVSQAYLSLGKGEEFQAENIRYVPGQLTYGAFVDSIMLTEEPAVAISIGPFQAAASYIAEIPRRHGAFTIGGSNRGFSIPFFAISCNYTVIGEELFAVGAYLEENANKIASFSGTDVAKIIFIVLVIAGSLLKTMGSDLILNLLKT